MEDLSLPPLKPNINQGELFLCDLADAPLKDDIASMEHPVFTISKKPDMRTKTYEHNENTLTIYPSLWGLATMYDKDILIYATSKIMQAKNAGEPISKTIVFEAQEALRFMHRTNKLGKAGGTEFRALEQSLRRLKGTVLETNIKTGGVIQTELFSIIDNAKIYREDKNGRVIEWGLTLSDWLYNAILNNEVLTLHPDYFRLRTPTEKRIYELVRRHCQRQEKSTMKLTTLLKKVGSSMEIRRFRFFIKKLSATNHLPDYLIFIDSNDIITFTKRHNSKVGKLKGVPERYSINSLDDYLDNKSYEICRKLAQSKNRDYYQLKQEFVELLNNSAEERQSIAGSFIGFIKAKSTL